MNLLFNNSGGPVEKLWGSLTKSGDANALRTTYQLAENLRPLLLVHTARPLGLQTKTFATDMKSRALAAKMSSASFLCYVSPVIMLIFQYHFT